MPDVTTTIDRHQRDGFYELIRNHLGSVGDLWLALENEGDFAKAERLGRQLGEDLRLLDDIGWRGNDDRESFELTMPPHELTQALNRLHDEAAAVLTQSPSERESREEDAGTEARLSLWRCASCLVEVAAGRSKRDVEELRGGSPILVAGQISDRWMIEGGHTSRSGVIVASMVKSGPAEGAKEFLL